MERTLEVLNELENIGVVVRYAIGGAIAATFYMEPVLTHDLDVFVSLSPTASQDPLAILSPIYKHLRQKGYETEHEHIVVEGVPVQFLPAYNPLVDEALAQARDAPFGHTKTRVLRAEHLIAIMLQTYRPKDRARMTQMFEEADIDRDLLTGILKRHGLLDKWQRFTEQFGVQ